MFVDRLFKGGDWPRYVKGLADCAFNHLNLEPEQVLNLKTRERLKKVNIIRVQANTFKGRIRNLILFLWVSIQLINVCIFINF